MIVISACLAEINCKYNGGNNQWPKAMDLLQSGRALPLCPEVLGGLSIPRQPCEIIRKGDERLVMTQEGIDHTKAFEKGAALTLNVCQALGVKLAILQARSPSCGKGMVYSGDFDGVLVEGNGLTVEKLQSNGIAVITMDEFIDFHALEIGELTQAQAEDIVHWTYDPPYDLYNMEGAYGAIAELLIGDYYGASYKGALVGFYCFGQSAQVRVKEGGHHYSGHAMDIGLGLRPDLCGLGYGLDFMKEGISYGKESKSASAYRLTVASFNQRAIKTYKKLGFTPIGTFTRKKDQETFEVMEMSINE